VPVFTPALRRACAIAAELPGAAAKPSGAGGGDCAIAFVAPADRLELRARWRDAGLIPLAVELDPEGARPEVTT
jgi:phosphomevalonate kinase